MNTRVKTAEDITAPMQIRSEVKQRGPLSPEAFNLTLEVVLRSVSKTGAGYTIEEQRISELTYANDVRGTPGKLRGRDGENAENS